ncbi:MAG TPA: gluconokinase, GntK/IdnK-type [Polyangia bacterium]|jgi:gluconokinase
MPNLRPPNVVVVMGVAGSGKTTVGTALAAALGWRFVDADDHHSAANVAKMARGEPLDDDDRRLWLDELHGITAEALARGADLVMACSALKAHYRARLAGADAGGRVRFVHLAGSPELFRARLAKRAGHFMKPGMLDSQFAALEPPAGDALEVDAGRPVAAIVAQIRTAFAI